MQEKKRWSPKGAPYTLIIFLSEICCPTLPLHDHPLNRQWLMHPNLPRFLMRMWHLFEHESPQVLQELHVLNGFRAWRGVTVSVHDPVHSKQTKTYVSAKQTPGKPKWLHEREREISAWQQCHNVPCTVNVSDFTPETLLWCFMKEVQKRCIYVSEFFGIPPNVDVLFMIESLQKDPVMPNHAVEHRICHWCAFQKPSQWHFCWPSAGMPEWDTRDPLDQIKIGLGKHGEFVWLDRGNLCDFLKWF